MAINLVELQAKWREMDIHPAAFDISQPNFADLAIRELDPVLTPLLEAEGYKKVTPAELPMIQRWSPFDMRKIYGVKTIEELPEWLLEACKTQKGMSFKDVIDKWTVPSWHQWAAPLFPEGDQLYFLRGAKGQENYSAIGLRHNAYPVTPYWKVMWTMQVDTIVGTNLGITGDMASSLVSAQDVREQYRVGRAGLLHRERLWDGDRYAPIWIDKNLVYSQQLIAKRGDGEYPFTEEIKHNVIEEVSQALRNAIIYDEKYRLSLLDLYAQAVKLGLPIDRVFASKQA